MGCTSWKGAGRLIRGVLVTAFVFFAGFAAAPAFAGAGGPNSFNTFSGDSVRLTSQDWAKLRQQRHQLYETLSPNYQMDMPFVSGAEVAALQQAIGRYQRIVASGGWAKVDPRMTVWPGDTSYNVIALRRRLMAEGDLKRNNGSSKFGPKLLRALARFQIRNGLPVTNFLDQRTIAALNIPARERLAQLKTNLQRMQSMMNINDAKRYVLVNIPAFTAQAVQDGNLVLSSRVVVGRPDRQTPLLDAHIIGINFFPIWRVPVDIAHKDLIPEIRKDPNYFYKEHFQVMPKWHAQPLNPKLVNWQSPVVYSYKFRQIPGDFNALGVVRINIPNKFSVYMHDTPLKSLFSESVRAFSSGCVRVQKVLNFVTWILQDEKGWDAEKVQAAAQAGQSVNVRLKKAVPVHFVYLTAWAQQNGTVDFRPDIYGRDSTDVNQEPGAGPESAQVAAQRQAISP